MGALTCSHQLRINDERYTTTTEILIVVALSRLPSRRLEKRSR